MKRAGATLLAVGLALPAAAAEDTRVFEGVSAAEFACMQMTSAAQQGTVYAQTGADRGTATTVSTLWRVVMEYSYAPDSGRLQYWLVEKSWIVPADAIWSGIESMVAQCAV